jgi:hypothetical protein
MATLSVLMLLVLSAVVGLAILFVGNKPSRFNAGAVTTFAPTSVPYFADRNFFLVKAKEGSGGC